MIPFSNLIEWTIGVLGSHCMPDAIVNFNVERIVDMAKMSRPQKTKESRKPPATQGENGRFMGSVLPIPQNWLAGRDSVIAYFTVTMI
jgi:hypothetical protein